MLLGELLHVNCRGHNHPRDDDADSGNTSQSRSGNSVLGMCYRGWLPCKVCEELLHAQVNNAGLGRNNSNLWDGSTASWVEMVSTNVLGVCMCTREAIQVKGPLPMMTQPIVCQGACFPTINHSFAEALLRLRCTARGIIP